jgi:hypothetical protein
LEFLCWAHFSYSLSLNGDCRKKQWRHPKTFKVVGN